jgi:tRNA threonylcarbamoyl adenosine modification protein YeaZ
VKILGIDTSTPVLSVAIVEDGHVLESIHKGELTGPQLHGEILATLLKDVLAHYTINAVAVGLGPGPYTGLRTGIAMGQAIAFAKGVEVTGVSSLHALAHGYWRRGGKSGVAVIDAKRKEIAWQEFDETSLKGSPTLTPLAQISILEDKVIIGPAFVTQPFDSVTVLDPAPPCAEDIAMLAGKGLGQPLSPLYMRTPDVN